MHNQRHFYRTQQLAHWQVEWLKRVSGRSWNVLKDSWASHYEKMLTWMSTHERIPSRRSKDTAEAELGTWAHNQCSTYSGRRLPLLSDEKLSQLLQLNSWRFPVPKVSWTYMFSELRKYCTKTSDLPKHTLHIRKPKRWLPLGLWYASQRGHSTAFGKGGAEQMERFRQWQESLPP